MCYGMGCPYEITYGRNDDVGGCKHGGFNGNPPKDAACYSACDNCEHDACIGFECEYFDGEC